MVDLRMEIMQAVQLHDKSFVPFISAEKIQETVQKLAQQIDKDFKHTIPLVVPILNGSYIFSADFTRALNIPFEISFLKMSSYQGTESTGKVNQLIGLNQDIKGRDIILLEDIVDTGNTLVKLFEILEEKEAASITIVTLLIKETVYNKSLPIHYKGLSIENRFVVGYGLDYDELGRGLDSIYVLQE